MVAASRLTTTLDGVAYNPRSLVRACLRPGPTEATMRAGTLRPSPLIGLLLLFALGCAGREPDGPIHVVLRFAPPSPTHVEFVTRTTAAISGPAFAGVALAERRMSTTERSGLDITRAEGEDVYRVSAGVAELPDVSAFLTGLSSDFYGRWRVGESRISAARMPIGSTMSASATTTVTLRSVGTLRGRSAALFTSRGTIAFFHRDAEFRVPLVGEQWVDLATGLPLRWSGRGTGTLMLGGKPGALHLEMITEVDWTTSRGL